MTLIALLEILKKVLRSMVLIKADEKDEASLRLSSESFVLRMLLLKGGNKKKLTEPAGAQCQQKKFT